MFAEVFIMCENHTELPYSILLRNSTVPVVQVLFGVGIPAPKQGENAYIRAALERIFSLSF